MLNQERIMLLVTENCNLNCHYCYEHKKNPSLMTFETAKGILDTQLEKCSPNKPIVIEVFGGEAFSNFSLIRSIDEYVSDAFPDLSIKYETTTNGTFVHGEVKEWLRQNKDKFFIALSLDGTREMHNLNRVYRNGSGSFDDIDIDFFVKTWPGCPAKMTVSDRTLPHLCEGVIYLERLGFKCDATLAIGTEWDPERSEKILIEQLNQLARHYIQEADIPLCTMLNLDFRQVFIPFDEDYRFCGAGVDMTCYDTKGNAYPCQGFAPISVGDVLAHDYIDFDERKFRFTDNNPCKFCRWVRLCPNCYAANLQSTGSIQHVDPNLCNFYKLCIMASAKIQFSRIIKKKIKNHDDQLVLKAIAMVQKELMF